MTPMLATEHTLYNNTTMATEYAEFHNRSYDLERLLGPLTGVI